MFHGIKDYIIQVAGATLTGATAIRNDVSNVAICWDGGRYWLTLLELACKAEAKLLSYSDITPKKHGLQVFVM
jgi:hypothetical protein